MNSNNFAEFELQFLIDFDPLALTLWNIYDRNQKDKGISMIFQFS